jgi:general secretion pathway protein A
MKDLKARFGFHTLPFTREIRIEDRYQLEPSEEALWALVRTVEERQSCALIAPSGTGKTAVLRALVTRLPEARYKTHYVKGANLSKRDMCREIATVLGTQPAGSFPMLVRRLQERCLQTLDTGGLRPVLIIDDAHEMRIEVLSLLRIITNFDMDSRLVLSIVLAGQPGLREALKRDQVEDVAKRLVHYATLRPLSREETETYIQHRCAVAGSRTLPFDARALDAVFEIGRGNLRATDGLCLKSLEIAHDQDKDVCDQDHVVQARKVLWP